MLNIYASYTLSEIRPSAAIFPTAKTIAAAASCDSVTISLCKLRHNIIGAAKKRSN